MDSLVLLMASLWFGFTVLAAMLKDSEPRDQDERRGWSTDKIEDWP